MSEAVGAPARPTFNYLSESISRRELTLTIGGLMMSLFLASLNQSIVNTAIPRIVSELNGFEIYAWVTTSYMLTSTAAVPVIGKIGDSHGRKPLLVGGTLYFLVTTALCGLAQDMTQLIVLRALQGVGGGHWVFLAAALVLLSALLAALFLRELPLRGRGSPVHSDSHVLRRAQGQRPRVQFGQTAQS